MPKKKDQPEAVPSAADRSRFYQGAAQERENERGESIAERDKRVGTMGNWGNEASGNALIQSAQSVRADMDRFRDRRVANAATRAAQYGDVAAGRKTSVPTEDLLPAYKTGGVVGQTGLAMVHKGERIIPAKENGEARSGRVIAPNAGWTVCPENEGQYTGANKPWRQ